MIFRGRALPPHYSEFERQLDDICPHRFDLRDQGLHGSLSEVAAKHGLWHRGYAHTGGSDALLTLELLFHAVTPEDRTAALGSEAKPSSKHLEISTEGPRSMRADSSISTRADGSDCTLVEDEAEGSGSGLDQQEEVEEDDTTPLGRKQPEIAAPGDNNIKCTLPACLLAAAMQCQQPLPPMPQPSQQPLQQPSQQQQQPQQGRPTWRKVEARDAEDSTTDCGSASLDAQLASAFADIDSGP